MPGSPPVVYLLHGDDEFAITQFVSEMEAKVGDQSAIAMNLTRLDGRTYNLDELLSVASAMPFLAKRRMIVLTNPTARLTADGAQKKFLDQLGKIPPTTALVLVEYRQLTEDRDLRKGKLHWLERWASQAGERVLLKAFITPKGLALVYWIQEQAKSMGGRFTGEAAELLATLAGGNPRLADQEIRKLLAYVNYQRPVEIDDVETLTADVGQGDVFVMVDALANHDSRQALSMLHRLLEQQEASLIFGMIVRQFRLLLQARDVLERGGQRQDIIQELRVIPFVADKIIGQVHRFTLPDLERIYHRLLSLDEAIKTGQIPEDLALETLTADLTI